MATIDDKDKKIGEVPHLEQLTGNEKIPVSANGEPRYVKVEQIAEQSANIPDVQATPKDNQVIYITNDGQPVELYTQSNVVDNKYYPTLGYGVLTLNTSTQGLVWNWFQGLTNVIEVRLPQIDSLTIVYDYAFMGCSSLEKVILSPNMRSFGNYAFSGCKKLKELNLSDDIRDIGNLCFANCYLLKFDKISLVNTRSYSGCTSIEEVIYDGNIDYDRAFENCTGIKKIIVKTRPSQTTFNGVNPEYVDTSYSSVEYLPLGSELKTLILRYNGVIEDLEENLSASKSSDLHVFVPENLLEAYREKYPSLIKHLHPLTGNDIWALESDVANLKTCLNWRRLGMGTNGYDFVDMGEAGIWATCNIGASKPEEYGLYFAWGETEGYETATDKSATAGFAWSTYEFGGSATNNSQSKYNSTDGLNILETEDDAVKANIGGTWRMPTSSDFQELINNTDPGNGTNSNGWITDYKGTGVNGMLRKGRGQYADREIFFPATGNADGTSLSSVGSVGNYWSSSLYTSNSYIACGLSFSSSNVVPQYYNYRSKGLSIRAILDTNK